MRWREKQGRCGAYVRCMTDLRQLTPAQPHVPQNGQHLAAVVDTGFYFLTAPCHPASAFRGDGVGHSSPVTPTLYHSCIPFCVDFAPWGQPHCVPLAPWLPALLLLSLNQPSLMGLTAEL